MKECIQWNKTDHIRTRNKVFFSTMNLTVYCKIDIYICYICFGSILEREKHFSKHSEGLQLSPYSSGVYVPLF